MSFAEEVINTALAELLREKFRIPAQPEKRRGRKKPDIVINQKGFRIILECRIAPALNLGKDARKRLEDDLADVSISVIYPSEINKINDFSEIKEFLNRCQYDVTIFYWGGSGIEKKEYRNLTLERLSIIIDEAIELCVKNDVLQEVVFEVKKSMDSLVNELLEIKNDLFSPDIAFKLKEILGILEVDNEKEDS